MNDLINRLIREKNSWERRIVDLGGPNHSRGTKIFDKSGKEVPQARGRGRYLYFGEARNLPGVKELLEAPEAPPTKDARSELHRRVDPDYYGFRDDEDGVLEKAEAEAESMIRERNERESEERRTAQKRAAAELGVHVSDGPEDVDFVDEQTMMEILSSIDDETSAPIAPPTDDQEDEKEDVPVHYDLK